MQIKNNCEYCSWKILLLLTSIFHSTSAASLRCYKGTLNNFEEVSLTQAQTLVNSTCIDHARPTVAYTFGYMGKVDGPATTAVLLAYLATEAFNVLLLNWQQEAADIFLNKELSYATSAVPNAKIVGEYFGEALTKLAEAGLDLTRLHLLAHSLGAHLMAYAGKRVIYNGHEVARITGLDPAGTLFEGPLCTHVGLDRWCARFVDVIHTDPSDYGMNCSVGNVDFWPNYSTTGAKQPGCPNGTFDKFSPEDLCSHNRVWQFLVEAIQSPMAFPAAFAANYYTWARNPAGSTIITYMGDLVNTSATGDYFLTTGSTSPYSLGLQGLYPNSNQTRR